MSDAQQAGSTGGSNPIGTSSAVAVIAGVLRAHQWRKYEDRCRCDDPCTYDEHPPHVAEMVDAALGGLARQYTPWGVVREFRALDEARANRLSGVNPLHEHRISSRWVSGWTPEERSEK
ncbi:hypothetical protein [Mycolicibacter kumamotonensis]|uniref:hypothetical protein n=1 Tax=Mycolicibacter kumamotonensis TaxID=354243 RepID=UPI0010420A20|nr:hypothetical protein [Mycolicibacter kumamotonensis]